MAKTTVFVQVILFKSLVLLFILEPRAYKDPGLAGKFYFNL